jgi:RNA polymerase sigma-70 factor (ECF subfamily)
MIQDREFEELMGRLRAGDDDAAAEVYNRFIPRLIGLIHRRLDRRLRSNVDPEDVAQSVFRSFFVRNAGGQFNLASWDSLMGVLTIITIRKCSRRARYFRAARRNMQREVRITAGADESGKGWQVADNDERPSEKVIMAEIVERLMDGLDTTEQPILLLSLQGFTVAEISARVERTERTVQRVLQRLRRRLEKMCAEEEDEPGNPDA